MSKYNLDNDDGYQEGFELGVMLAQQDVKKAYVVKQAGLGDVFGGIGGLAAEAPGVAAMIAVLAGAGGGVLYNTLAQDSAVDDLKLEAKRKKISQMRELAKGLQARLKAEHDAKKMQELELALQSNLNQQRAIAQAGLA